MQKHTSQNDNIQSNHMFAPSSNDIFICQLQWPYVNSYVIWHFSVPQQMTYFDTHPNAIIQCTKNGAILAFDTSFQRTLFHTKNLITINLQLISWSILSKLPENLHYSSPDSSETLSSSLAIWKYLITSCQMKMFDIYQMTHVDTHQMTYFKAQSNWHSQWLHFPSFVVWYIFTPHQMTFFDDPNCQI